MAPHSLHEPSADTLMPRFGLDVKIQDVHVGRLLELGTLLYEPSRYVAQQSAACAECTPAENCLRLELGRN
jgi:hypothetical protein